MTAACRLGLTGLVWMLAGSAVGVAAALAARAAEAAVVPCTDVARALGAAGSYPECEPQVSLVENLSRFGLLGLVFAALGILIMPGMRLDWATMRSATRGRLTAKWHHGRHRRPQVRRA